MEMEWISKPPLVLFLINRSRPPLLSLKIPLHPTAYSKRCTVLNIYSYIYSLQRDSKDPGCLKHSSSPGFCYYTITRTDRNLSSGKQLCKNWVSAEGVLPTKPLFATAKPQRSKSYTVWVLNAAAVNLGSYCHVLLVLLSQAMPCTLHSPMLGACPGCTVSSCHRETLVRPGESPEWKPEACTSYKTHEVSWQCFRSKILRC